MEFKKQTKTCTGLKPGNLDTLFEEINHNPKTVVEKLVSLNAKFSTQFVTEHFDVFLSQALDFCSDFSLDYSVSLLTFLYRLRNIREWSDLVILSIDFVNGTIGVREALKQSKKIFSYVKKCIKAFIANFVSPQGRFSDLFEEYNLFEGIKKQTTNVKTGVNSIRSVLSSELLSSLRDLILRLVSFRFFSFDISQKFINTLGPSKKGSYLDFIESVLSAGSHMFTVCHGFATGKTFTELFASGSRLSAWIDRSHEMILESTNLYTGLPVEGKTCARVFYSELVDLITEATDVLMISTPKDAPNYITFKNTLGKLKIIRNDLRNSSEIRFRKMPLCVMIHGDPGIGKSVVLQHVAEVFSAVKGRDFKEEHMYARQPSSEYWSGYEPLSQPIIHYSEPGSVNFNIAKAKGDPIMDEILSVVDSLPFQCNMADLESKGKVYACPEMVLIDCNDEEMNLRYLKNNPSAVRRRILYIHPTVKKEFCRDSVQIDHELVKAASEREDFDPRDIWNFSIYRQDPLNNVQSVPVSLGENLDIRQLSSVFANYCLTHFQKQESAKAALDQDINDYLPNQFHILRDPVLPQTHEVEDEENIIELTDSNWFFYIKTLAYLWFPMMFFGFLYGWISTTIFWNIIAPNWKTYSFLVVVIKFFSALELTTFKKIGDFATGCYTKRKVLTRCVRVAFGIVVVYILYNIISLMGHDYLPVRYLYKERISTMKYEMATLLSHLRNPKKVAEPTEDRNLLKYAFIFSALYVGFSTSRSLRQTFSQGNTVSSSKDWTEEEMSITIAEAEKNAERPRKVGPKINSQDWSNSIAPYVAPVSKSKNNFDDIFNSIQRNVRFIVIEGSQTADQFVLGIKSNHAIINRHALGEPRENGTWTLTTTKNKDDKMNKRKFVLHESEVTDVSTDIVLIQLRNELFHDITPFLCEQWPKAILGFSGKMVDTAVRAYQAGPQPFTTPLDTQSIFDHTYRYNYKNNYAGMCGQPLVLQGANSPTLIGIHCGAVSNTEICFADCFLKNMILDAIKKHESKFPLMPLASQGEIRLPSAYPDLVPTVDVRHPLSWESCASITVLGTIKNLPVIPNRPSSLKKTLLFNYAEELSGVSPFRQDGEEKFVPPPMRDVKTLFTNELGTKQVKKDSHAHDFIRKVGVDKKTLDPELMQITIETVVSHLVTNLKERGVEKLSPVPLEVATNGDPDNFFMRSMKASTSGGFVWPGPKSNHMDEIDLDYNPNSKYPDAEVREQVCEILSAYKNNTCAHPILGCQPKDEARKNGKMTRTFTMSPFCNTLVHRMFLMPFYSLMVEHDDVFCAAIGINMHSYDVDTFVNKLRNFSDFFGEGDYGGYDTSMPPDITYMTNTIVYQVLIELGYSEEDLTIVRGILTDNIFTTMVLRGVIFSSFGNQPSGKYATAEDNSLKGLVLLVYYWIETMTVHGEHSKYNKTTKYSPLDFFKNVLPKLYGDDVLMAIKKRVLDQFNNTTYQLYCKEVYGMKFTASDKSDIIPKCLRWRETSFLKRNFVFREDLNHWVAPLSLNSLMKTVAYTLPSRNVEEEVQVHQACQSVMRELFFHLNKEKFTQRRLDMIRVLCDSYSLPHNEVTKTFPMWDELRDQIYPLDKGDC